MNLKKWLDIPDKKKSCEISTDQGFKVLKLLKDITQFCRVSRGQALSEIFRGKVKTLKIPGEFSKMFSTILGNWDVLKRALKKLFGLVLMHVSLPEER